MKKLIHDLCVKHENNIAWFLVASVGWGLAFWYMPSEIRHPLSITVLYFAITVAGTFLVGLFFRWTGWLWLFSLAVGFSILRELPALFNEASDKILPDNFYLSMTFYLGVLIGLNLACRCPSWSSIIASVRKVWALCHQPAAPKSRTCSPEDDSLRRR